MTKEQEDNKWCTRCQEDFPIAEDVKGRVQMGLLYPLKRFPKKIREHYEVKQGTGSYLCGNCYFDILSIFEEGI